MALIWYIVHILESMKQGLSFIFSALIQNEICIQKKNDRPEEKKVV